MSKTLEISDLIFSRLQRLATPLIDTPESVIKKLIDHYESDLSEKKPLCTISANTEVTHKATNVSLHRIPRQRGARIKIGDDTFRVSSVSELYSKALEYLDRKGHLNKVNHALPYATSSKRYLIANSPIHPNGRDFFAPVKYKEYYMEAHKSYELGIRHLRILLDLCGIPLTYLD